MQKASLFAFPQHSFHDLNRLQRSSAPKELNSMYSLLRIDGIVLAGKCGGKDVVEAGTTCSDEAAVDVGC